MGERGSGLNRCVILILFSALQNPRARPRSNQPSANSRRNSTRIRARSRKRRKNSPRSARPMKFSGDEKKRAAFDRGEIDAEGKPRHPGFEGFGAGGPAAGRMPGRAPASKAFRIQFRRTPGRGRGRLRGQRHIQRAVRRRRWTPGRARRLRAAAARRGCSGDRDRQPQRGGDRRAGARDLAERAHARSLGSGGHRGRQADPPQAAGPFEPRRRRAGRRHRHRENCQTSLFPRRGTRRAPRPAGDPL